MTEVAASVTEVEGPFAYAPFSATLAGLLLDRAARCPDRVLLTWEATEITTAEVALAAHQFAGKLRDLGVQPGDAVLTMVEAGPAYISLFLGATLVGATWVPQAPDARGPSLAHVLSITRPVLVIAAPHALENIMAAGHDDVGTILKIDGWGWPAPSGSNKMSDPELSNPDNVRAVLFTSGTTGPPKGVVVTERMLLASAAGCAFASKCKVGSVFLMWEPMHHIGGPQLVIMALVHGARLVVVKRFSASRFWPLVRAQGVTKLHYLGGILEILLKAKERTDDKDNPVGLAFGGGCRPETRGDFIERFSIPIREVFGMTEASSFTTVDDKLTKGSIGQALPWMQVELVEEDGQPVAEGAAGEIVVRPRYSGLLTPGYLGDAEATARLVKRGWLHTGDLGRRDSEGNYYFLGRNTDSLRRRGENVSAWEIETALAGHPEIAETAIVGVPSEIGEADILCFVAMREDTNFDPAEILDWCRNHLPRHHIPRYWKRVDGFERTPSQRIRKDSLDLALADTFDADEILQGFSSISKRIRKVHGRAGH